MKKQKIKITTDSSSDFYPLAEEFGVDMVPQVIVLGDTEYFDGVNVNANDVYEYVAKTKKLPKTAAISGTYIEEMFEKLSKENDAVIHVSISSKLSTSIEIAQRAAKKFKNVFVVDSLGTCGAQGILVMKAAELAKQGKSVDEIIKTVEGLRSKVVLGCVVQTLDFLHKGGRVSGLKKVVASLLKIKPMLGLVDGKIVAMPQKYKGKHNIVLEQFMKDRFSENPNADKEVCIVLYGKMPDEYAAKAELQAKDAGFKKVYKIPLGANMTCHSGPGTLVVVFLTK